MLLLLLSWTGFVLWGKFWLLFVFPPSLVFVSSSLVREEGGVLPI